MNHPPSSSKNSVFYAEYWRYYWPLSLVGIAELSGGFARNFVLLLDPQGIDEMAWFTVAQGLLNPFRISLSLFPQMITVKGENPTSRFRCLYFVLLYTGILWVLCTIVAVLPFMPSFVQKIYNIQDTGVRRVIVYLLWLSPTLLISGIRSWSTGIFAYAKYTHWITILRYLDLSLTIFWLFIGKWWGLSSAGLMILSSWGTELIALGIILFAVYRIQQQEQIELNHEKKIEPESFSSLWSYFWPLAGTACMFTLSRPIIYFFATRYPPEGMKPELMISGINLSLSFSLIFQSTINQLRFVVVRFGSINRQAVARFSFYVALGTSGLMLISVLTPVACYFFRYLQNATGELLELAIHGVWGLWLIPLAVAWRNYYHGLAMIYHETTSLIYGGFARNLSILVVGYLLGMFRLFNVVTGSGLMVVAFSAEALAVVYTTSRWRGEILKNPSEFKGRV